MVIRQKIYMCNGYDDLLCFVLSCCSWVRECLLRDVCNSNILCYIKSALFGIGYHYRTKIINIESKREKKLAVGGKKSTVLYVHYWGCLSYLQDLLWFIKSIWQKHCVHLLCVYVWRERERQRDYLYIVYLLTECMQECLTENQNPENFWWKHYALFHYE